MNKIDNIFKKVFDKKGFNTNINKILGKPILGKPILGKNNLGASFKMQNKWKSFDFKKKNFYRNILKDTDKDKVPNIFDCQPFNRKKQDTPRMKLYEKLLNKTGRLKNLVEKLGYPVFNISIINEKFEILKDLKEKSYIPIRVLANIPSTSNLGIIMKKNKYYPNEWFLKILKRSYFSKNYTINLISRKDDQQLLINYMSAHDLEILNDPDILLEPKLE